ncbi:MAG: peroxiredoxin-like family protein [Pseudolabrys sp.]
MRLPAPASADHVEALEQDRPAMASQSPTDDVRSAFQQAAELDGSMQERLDLFAETVRRQHPASAAIVDRFVRSLSRHDAGVSAPRPGDAMPPFALPDENGQIVSLADLLKDGPAIVTFHRGHWCPYCRISMSTLAQAQHEIQQRGARMVAIVPETARYARAMKDQAKARFPILLDMDNGYAMSLNLAVWIDGEMKEMMSALGRALPDYQGNDAWMLPIPATFVVGRDGRITARFVDPDYRKRMAIDDLLAALKA